MCAYVCCIQIYSCNIFVHVHMNIRHHTYAIILYFNIFTNIFIYVYTCIFGCFYIYSHIQARMHIHVRGTGYAKASAAPRLWLTNADPMLISIDQHFLIGAAPYWSVSYHYLSAWSILISIDHGLYCVPTADSTFLAQSVCPRSCVAFGLFRVCRVSRPYWSIWSFLISSGQCWQTSSWIMVNNGQY